MSNFEQSFFAEVDRLMQGQKPACLAVAVSGGADSLCLALLLKLWTQYHNISLKALTVDHGLRAESHQEACDVQQFLQSQGISHEVLTWLHGGCGTRIQERAREARYKLLTEYCQNHEMSHLFLAHHKNDQVETFLYRLSRSSGPDGLSGMQGRVLKDGICLVRPFLNFTKEEIQSYLQHKNISWSEDPSNMNENFTRVRIRQFLPQLQMIDIHPQTLHTVMRKLQRSRNALEFYTIAFLKEYAHIFPTGYITLQLPQQSVPEDIILRALSWILWHVSGSYYQPRHMQIEALWQHLQSSSFRPITYGGCYIMCRAGKATFMREQVTLTDVPLESGKRLYWDGRFRICVTGIKQGVMVGPIQHNKDLRERFSEIPSYVLRGLPCLKIAKEVLAVPGLNYYSENEFVSQKDIVDWTFDPRRNLFKTLFTIA